MSGASSSQLTRVEAPVTFKAYMICAFAAFGGIFFGYDSGYINGVLGMDYVIHMLTKGPTQTTLPSWMHSLIVSILSLGTFLGALISADIADRIGRRNTIIASCGIFAIGAILQTASTTYQLLVGGRIIAGLGVGGVSAMIILYMSEIAPKKVRGALVSGYQFCITIGILLASCVTYATQNREDAGSYRIPIALQLLWAIILAGGLLFLPESPRYYINKGDVASARRSLARVRGQPEGSQYVVDELAEIEANLRHELSVMPKGGYFQTWLSCFKGSLFQPSSNLRRTILGTSLQMMQQWTGVNFVFYFGTSFFKSLGTVKNPFSMSLVLALVNVLSTPISFWTVEKFGRRALLIWGAAGMVVCQFIVAIVGTATEQNPSAVIAMISFLCIYVFFFASTWGPGAWVVIGEIFPLPIRARGVGLSTASNWLWNYIIALITPYMVDPDKGNLGAKVFFVWGSLCCGCFIYAYFLVYETKGLTLEQVDMMIANSFPRTSVKWTPTTTFAAQDPGMPLEDRDKLDTVVSDKDVSTV